VGWRNVDSDSLAKARDVSVCSWRLRECGCDRRARAWLDSGLESCFNGRLESAMPGLTKAASPTQVLRLAKCELRQSLRPKLHIRLRSELQRSAASLNRPDEWDLRCSRARAHAHWHAHRTSAPVGPHCRSLVT
jgi:hypothetical protein